jgi:threonine synthase
MPEEIKLTYSCSKCSKNVDVKTHQSKCECGGLWKLKFTPPLFDLGLIDKSIWGLFRYKAFLPVDREVWKDITLGEGMTPIISFDKNILLKMDYFMPTLSFKDRGAAVLVAHCKTIGVDSVVQDSSGNAGNSIAAYCGKAGIDCEIFVPEGTSQKKIDILRAHKARVNIVPGSRDHCADVCRAKVDIEGRYYASHVYNPFFYEGTKTYIFETYEQLKRIPAHIITPLGNGSLFLGIVKGLEELTRGGLIKNMPKIIAVQSQIAVGRPMRGEEILEYIYKYDVEVITAPEDQIIAARDFLSCKGVYSELTTAASYAAYLKYCKINGEISDCLMPVCGAGIKSDH